MAQFQPIKALFTGSPMQTMSNLSTSITSIKADKIQVTDVIVDRKIELIDSASQMFSKYNEFVEINDQGIFSSINNKNALVMLETIKNLLIKNNYFSEEEFTKEYNEIEQQIQLRIDGFKVAEKLTDPTKNY